MSEEVVQTVEAVEVAAPPVDAMYAGSMMSDEAPEEVEATGGEEALEVEAPEVGDADAISAEQISAEVKQYLQNMVKNEGIEAVGDILGVDIPASAQFAKLARKTSESRKFEQSLVTREKVVKESEQVMKMLEENPFKFFEDRFGKDAYSKYTDYILNDGRVSEEDTLKKQMQSERDEIVKLKEETQGRLKELADSQRAMQIESVTAGYENTLSSIDYTESYPSLSAFHGGNNEAIVNEVYDILTEVKNQQSRSLGRAVSPREVQDILKEWTPERALSMLNEEAQKLGTRFTPAVASPPQPQRPPESRPNTLNSEISSTSGPAYDMGDDFDDVSNDERRRRVLAKYG